MATMLTKASTGGSLRTNPDPHADELQHHRQGSALQEPVQVLDPRRA